jgi:A/G-specific adenine glycosylase
MKLFPTVEILAQATNTEVLSARSGLGYNSRGLRVKQAAEKIANEWKFPTTYENLIALPGIGDYVASAILAFAYNENVAVIDTNIRRILIHQFALDEKTSLKDLKAIALEILPRGYAREWYNALMDYGALELTAKRSGIRPTTRQSKFEWSRRQVRAWVVKQLVDNKDITMIDIQKRFSDRDDVQSIIDELIKENVIEYINEKFLIKD